MRLIDADALADALFDQRRNYPQWVADTIGGMPDAVVRCKDCKFQINRGRKYPECDKHFLWAMDNWYCADGERRTESSKMPNIEKTIKCLEICTGATDDCAGHTCPYWDFDDSEVSCRTQMEMDALALLKAQREGSANER